MKHIIRALAFALGLLPLAAMAQSAPANLPAMSVYGRLGFPGTVGPGQAVPFSALATQVVSPFLPYVQPETYGAKRDGTTDDTAAINAAISAAAASHRGVLLSGGGSYCVRPITITDVGGSMPAFFSGQPASQAALLACNTSSSPTLTLSAFSFNGFVAENFRVNSFSKHATGILITKFIRGRVRNISATGATGAGFKFLGVGTPAGNVEYSSFRDLLSIANGGIGFDFESDATCQPGSCIAANDFSNLSAYNNLGDGYFVDYASIHCKNCEAEGNSGYALNLNHTYVGNWDGFYGEANALGGPNATASTFGISMIGARLGDTTGIGQISTFLTSCTTCLIDIEEHDFGSRVTNFGAFSAQSANVAGGVSAGGSALFTGDFNVATGGGYRINGGATTNHVLCGNAGGTKYVDCGTLSPSVLPNPTASTLGGIESYVAVAHQWINSISTSGVPSSTQPVCADISNAGTVCTQNTGTSGATVPLLNGNNTYSGTSTHSGQIITTFGTPTIASGACGTGTNGTISGTNQAGTVTIGATATTTCTVSFSATITAPNACTITPGNATAAAQGTTLAWVGAPSTSQWVITGSALASTVYRYHCI